MKRIAWANRREREREYTRGRRSFLSHHSIIRYAGNRDCDAIQGRIETRILSLSLSLFLSAGSINASDNEIEASREISRRRAEIDQR